MTKPMDDDHGFAIMSNRFQVWQQIGQVSKVFCLSMIIVDVF